MLIGGNKSTGIRTRKATPSTVVIMQMTMIRYGKRRAKRDMENSVTGSVDHVFHRSAECIEGKIARTAKREDAAFAFGDFRSGLGNSRSDSLRH